MWDSPIPSVQAVLQLLCAVGIPVSKHQAMLLCGAPDEENMVALVGVAASTKKRAPALPGPDL